MTDTLTVHQAIAAVMRAMPAIGKDSKVTEGPQRYQYRGIEAIKAALKPLLAEHGVFYSPTSIERIEDSVYEAASGKPWQRVRMVVNYRVYGPDGQWIEAVGRGEGADNSDKACNKAMTVAEKQMLVQVFCIADAEGDPDAHRAEEQAAAVDVTAAGLKGAVADALGRERAKAWWEHRQPGAGPWSPREADVLLKEAKAWDGPEAAADAPADIGKPTKAAMGRLMATLAEAKIADDERHDWASLELKREVVSFTELTRSDVSLLTERAAALIPEPVS